MIRYEGFEFDTIDEAITFKIALDKKETQRNSTPAEIVQPPKGLYNHYKPWGADEDFLITKEIKKCMPGQMFSLHKIRELSKQLGRTKYSVLSRELKIRGELKKKE